MDKKGVSLSSRFPYREIPNLHFKCIVPTSYVLSLGDHYGEGGNTLKFLFLSIMMNHSDFKLYIG